MNYLAIVVASVVNMVIGFLWYGPLFGKKWMALSGMTEEQVKSVNPAPLYAQSFVAVLISYYVLARFISPTATVTEGIEVAALVWVGFVTTVQFTASLFSTKPRALYYLDTGYQLVTYLAAGTILAAWR